MDHLALKNRTAAVRDRLKIAIADREIRLDKERLRMKQGDAAALKRVNRLQDTLTLYKLTFAHIERSAAILAKS